MRHKCATLAIHKGARDSQIFSFFCPFFCLVVSTEHRKGGRQRYPVISTSLTTRILTHIANISQEAERELKTLRTRCTVEDGRFRTGISEPTWCLSAPTSQDSIFVITSACYAESIMSMLTIDRSRDRVEEFLSCEGVDQAREDACLRKATITPPVVAHLSVALPSRLQISAGSVHGIAAASSNDERPPCKFSPATRQAGAESQPS